MVYIHIMEHQWPIIVYPNVPKDKKKQLFTNNNRQHTYKQKVLLVSL